MPFGSLTTTTGMDLPWTVTLVRQLPRVFSVCWTVPTENARLAIMAPSAAPSGSCARRFVTPSMTTDWTSWRVCARTVVLPTVTL
jgi:hypothetical protein